MLMYACDGPNCNRSVGVDDEEAKYWLVVMYMDEEDEEEYHYCSWKCLAEDAAKEAEFEAKHVDVYQRAISRIRRMFVLKSEKKDDEERRESGEVDGSSEGNR